MTEILDASSDEMRGIVEKIRKLMQLASKNPNPHEAEAAAAKARDLLQQYNLDVALIEQQQGRVDGKREIAKTTGGFYLYQRKLYEAVAELNYCMYATEEFYDVRDKTIIRRGRRYAKGTRVLRTRHRLVGRTVNTAATKVMATYLENAIERLARERLTDSTGKCDVGQLYSAWGISFREGAVDNIVSRLYEEKRKTDDKRRVKERKDEALRRAQSAGASSSMSLTLAKFEENEEQGNYDFLNGDGAWARMKSRVAEAAEQARIERERLAKLAKENPEEFRRVEEERRKDARRYRGRSSRQRYITDYSAYNSGHEAGGKVSIHQQVGEKSSGMITHGR